MAKVLSAVSAEVADRTPIKTALISVSDKTGITDLAKFLVSRHVRILSTGGTAKSLRDAGVEVVDVSDHTGFPEILDGRVKTLHPKIHGGLLAVRGNEQHKEAMEANDITPIDLVIVNLYVSVGNCSLTKLAADTLHISGSAGGHCLEGCGLIGLTPNQAEHCNITPKAHMNSVSLALDPICYLPLQAFEKSVASGRDAATCIENIDIGGPSMLRSAAKNHFAVAVLPSSSVYDAFIAQQADGDDSCSTTLEFRRQMAAMTFAMTAAYDSAIAGWFGSSGVPAIRTYQPVVPLKYGCNPHQNPSWIGSIASQMSSGDASGGASAKLPFTVLNGTPGYINFLDAANAWQLAAELAQATGLPAAASFKHVSPAGAAVAVPLSAMEREVYDVDEAKAAALTPVALAYLRARNADPMCSFGDFAAVSHVVDEATAQLLKPEVSDGIVAPGFTPDALAILKTKKSGNFIILQGDPDYKAPVMEYREVFGMAFAQRRNDRLLTSADVTGNIVTSKKGLPDGAVRDLLVALISIKYTQSNSVGYATDGQMIGVGAGQQSRVDCVKLAGNKVATWYLRQHPKVRGLKFKAGVKRQDKVNARVRFIEGGFTDVEYAEWVSQFEEEPSPLTDVEKSEFLTSLKGVSIASDAFFPFRDSIDVASRYGVSYVSQPGGSVKDADVTRAADEYGMLMSHSGVRLFHH